MKRKMNIKPVIKGGIFSLIVGGLFALLAMLKISKEPQKEEQDTEFNVTNPAD